MLKVHSDLDVEFIALELYELEVTEPREDFELEIARATQAVRTGTIGDVSRAPPFTAGLERTRPACVRRTRRCCAG